MRKILTITTIALFGLGAYWFLNKNHQEVENTKPGYYEQWSEMKTMGTGIVPEGIVSSWHNQSKSLRRVDGAIEGITEVGPYNVAGRIRALMFDYSNENRYFAAGISGGLWVSENKGTSWAPVNEQEVNLNVSCIDQSKTNPAIIYYGTGEGSANSVGFGGNGIYKSTDTGKTFQHLSSTDNANFTHCWKLKIDPNNEDIIYVGTDRRGLFRSIDGGQSWIKLISTTNEVNDVDILPDGKVFATVKGGGIYYSATGELASFSKIVASPIPTSSFGRVELAYCRDKSNVIYSAFSSTDNGYNGTMRGVYKSTDTGQSWTAVSTPPSSTISVGFSWYCKIMEVHPTNSDVVFLASVTPGFSTNGGASWSKASNPHTDYHSAAINPHNPNELMVGNDAGVGIYPWDEMTTSKTLNNGLNITQFYHGSYHPNTITLAGGTQDNGTRYSENQNQNFNRILGGDGAFTHVVQELDNVVYASSQNGNIRRLIISTGAASSTTNIKNELDDDNNGSIDEGASFINPFWMNYNNGSQLFFVTQRGVWRSNNAGSNWNKITGLRPSAYSVGISSDADPTIYIGGSSVLARVDNAGTVTTGSNEVNFINKLPALVGNYLACTRVSPVNKGTIYVGLSNYATSSRFYCVQHADTDTPKLESLGGNLPTNLPINSFDIDPQDPENTFVVGTDYGLYSTTDRGATWHKHLEIPNVSVNTVQIRKTDGRVFIYTHGRGAFQGVLKNRNNTSLSSVKDIEVKMYPNPAKNQLNLEVGQEGEVIYTVFNMNGQRVKAAILDHTKTIDISKLSKGNYFLVVKQNGIKKTIKWQKD